MPFEKTGGVANPTYESKLLWDCNCAYTPVTKIALPLSGPDTAQRYRVRTRQCEGLCLRGVRFFVLTGVAFTTRDERLRFSNGFPSLRGDL